MTWAFNDIATFGKDGNAERDLYADFLDEAAITLNRPALGEAAAGFREAAVAWNALGQALLPDEVEPLRETRERLLRRHALFMDEGDAATAALRDIDARLAAIRAAAVDFPLDAAGVTAFRERIAGHVLRLHDIEAAAVTALRAAMS